MQALIIRSKGIVKRPREKVWGILTDTKSWKTWYGGGIQKVDPAWENGASVIWELGSPGKIADLVPQEKLSIVSDSGIVTTFRLTDAPGSSTLVECEEEISALSLSISDPAKKQEQCDLTILNLIKFLEAPKKNALLAAVLSFFIPGLGQLYNGHLLKAIIYFFCSYFGALFVIGILVWIWAVIDAYVSANQINKGQPAKNVKVCPDCKTPLPAIRKPKNRNQALWGGWTCEKCGCEINARGQKIN